MHLVIVESPTKSRTIQNFLPKDYVVKSSFGHIRDLPKSELGVDIEHDFTPQYVIPTKSRKVVSELKKEVKKVNVVILASVDYDEPILIQYPDELVRMEKIGKFIDWLLDSNNAHSGFRVGAFDFASHNISFMQIKHAIRHPVKEKLLRIKTEYGRTITITASHSLFQKEKSGCIKSVAGKDLRKGDSILVPVTIPRGRKDLSGQRIDVLRALYENEGVRSRVFIKGPSIAEYRKSKLLAPGKGDTSQFAPRIFFTNALRRNLQEWRIAHGWSQRVLAKQVGCSQSDISEWEGGRGNPTLTRGKQYLKMLGVRFEKLVTEKKLTVGPSSIEQAIAQALETQWHDSRKSKSRSWQPLSWFTWEELERNFSDDETIEISRSNHSHRMPRFISIDHDLMLFLGFFTAEGSFVTQGKYIRFSFGPKSHGAEAAHIMHIRKITQRLFNLTPSDFTEKTGHSVVLNSTLVTFFLKEIFGIKSGAEHKDVPRLVFNVCPSVQFSFLKGCFLGDGTLGKAGIAFNTISPFLAQGISYLLLQNSILSSHSLAISKKPNRKPIHQITITGKDKLLALLPVWEDHYKAQLLKDYCSKNVNLKQNFSLAKEKSGSLALLVIKDITETKASSNYVYDFSVKGENFVCGSGGICAHNTDEDREGEAIAWHLVQALELKGVKNKKSKIKSTERIVFHEITKSAIENALQNPRDIDMDLVDAQQARRILDRLVGYKLSPFLWKKVARGLSAGRVQSVAVRLIVDREREIQAFRQEEYWTIEAKLRKNIESRIENLEFSALLIKKGGEVIPKLGIKTQDEAEKILKNLDGAEYRVEKIERKEVRRNPLPPFTTSTLQQEVSKKFGMSSKATMAIAQALYENGYITYHRTDSLNVSEQALGAARDYITKEFGEKYYSARTFKTKSKGAQEAHEAIRPTSAERRAEVLKLDTRAKKVYALIWRRFVASQMAQAVFDATTVDIVAPSSPLQAPSYTFRANGSILKFDGFLKVYPIKYEKNELPKLSEQELLELIKLTPFQHFTQPPPRYSEATLIKELEKNGIGRPSTYAPIISTIQQRNYVLKNEQKKFAPTEIGTAVNDLLVEHFPKIVDIGFTANMEEDLDQIAAGKEKWVPVIHEFYKPFAENLEKKYAEVERKTPAEETDKICPECGKNLLIRFGRFGRFYACSGFPDCKHTEPLEKKQTDLGITCPKCDLGSIAEKRTKRGKIFYSCNRYPHCDFALWDKPIRQAQGGPTGEKCEKCGFLIVLKGNQTKCSSKECNK